MTAVADTIQVSPPRPQRWRGEFPFDVAVVGAGIVGLATAMALTRERGLSVVVIEAENKVAAHQTGHNSGVIHAGLYYKPGSLKAKLSVNGRRELYAFCAEHNVPHEACGKLVVATSEAEIPALEELERRGQANGVEGLRRISLEELHEREPHVNGVAAVHSPVTGIVDYKAVAVAMVKVICAHGGDVRLETALTSVRQIDNQTVLETSRGPVRAKALVNCAGLHSDRVAKLCGIDPDVRIIPFRGEYYELSTQAASLVENLIYPVPDARFPFLGVHFTRMIGGGVEAGPNAVLALARHGYGWSDIEPVDVRDTVLWPGFWKMACTYWRMGCGEFHRSLSKPAFLCALQKLLPELQLNDLTPGGSGVRAQAVDRSGKLVDDFRIVRAFGQVHVLNAPSPAATASIAIGRAISELVPQVASVSTTL
jgi:L-2-hydroxyglutarate oxidase